jgi:hypothetical protein
LSNNPGTCSPSTTAGSTANSAGAARAQAEKVISLLLLFLIACQSLLLAELNKKPVIERVEKNSLEASRLQQNKRKSFKTCKDGILE